MNRYLAGIGMIGATALIVWAGSARADGLFKNTGLLCDTQAQVEQFIESSKADGDEAAIKKINAEKPVCAVGSVVFERHEDVKHWRDGKGAFVITRITVVAVLIQGVWGRVAPEDQFTIFQDTDTPT